MRVRERLNDIEAIFHLSVTSSGWQQYNTQCSCDVSLTLSQNGLTLNSPALTPWVDCRNPTSPPLGPLAMTNFPIKVFLFARGCQRLTRSPCHHLTHPCASLPLPLPLTTPAIFTRSCHLPHLCLPSHASQLHHAHTIHRLCAGAQPEGTKKYKSPPLSHQSPYCLT